MNQRVADVAEVDAFLSQTKTLQGGHPPWKRGGFRGEWTATWPIEDDLGIVRAQLRFRAAPGYERYPSVSLIVRNNVAYRLDLIDGEACKPNPHWAYHLGLPAIVCNSHVHAWNDNRDYLLRQDRWHLPARRPLAPQIKRLDQAVPWLADEINLTVTADQRGFEGPVGTLLG